MADVVDIPEFRAFYYTDDTPRQFYTLRRYEYESGSGEMRCYNIAPGIQLSFNDLNLSSCYQPLNVQKDFLEINYCLEGGHEVEMVGGGITFLGEKDLSISGLYHDRQIIVNSRIPFNKYKGITILLELETAQTTLNDEFSRWRIDLQKIRTTLCPEGRVLLIKSKQKIDHIFTEIKKLGYVTHIKLLNASDYGVPQLRPRVVIVGIRKDQAGAFEYPQEHPGESPTVGETLCDLMSQNGWKGAKKWAEGADRIAPTLVGGSKKHGGPDLGPTRAKNAWAELGVDGKGIANEAPEPDFDGMPRLTSRMMARIQGFPDTWTFGNKKTVACRMIGNAFPPPVAQAVGIEIRRCLENAER